jgi:phage terminase large subunit
MKLKIKKEIFNGIYAPHVVDYSTRYEVYYGGAGSGKSFFVAQKLVIKALQEPRKILVLRKVGKTIKNSVFQLLIDTLDKFKIKDRCKINKTDFSITLPNGSLFICSGLDDPEKIKSITGLTDAWLEEATEFVQDDFNQIDLRIRHPVAAGQQLILSFNPVSKASWCYLQFFDKNPSLDEFRSKVKIIHSSYLDNIHLPQSYIDSLLLLKDTNPVYYKIYALGEFGSLDKLVYNNWQVLDFNVMRVKGQQMCGLDFGYTNDPTAFVASLINEE